MGLIVQNEDDGKFYELTLRSEYVEKESLVAQACQGCGNGIGLFQVEDLDDGDGPLFVPYIETLAVMRRDDEESGNEDFTGASCVRCGLGHLYNAKRVLIDDGRGFVGALVELDGRI